MLQVRPRTGSHPIGVAAAEEAQVRLGQSELLPPTVSMSVISTVGGVVPKKRAVN
jgi:hypothetical protein